MTPEVASTQGQVVAKVEDSTNYMNLIPEVEKPHDERKAVVVGRLGVRRKPRCYHLTEDQKKQKVTTMRSLGGEVVNPLVGREGTYWAQVEALIRLGANEWHSLKAVRDQMQLIMSGSPAHKDTIPRGNPHPANFEPYAQSNEDHVDENLSTFSAFSVSNECTAITALPLSIITVTPSGDRDIP